MNRSFCKHARSFFLSAHALNLAQFWSLSLQLNEPALKQSNGLLCSLGIGQALSIISLYSCFPDQDALYRKRLTRRDSTVTCLLLQVMRSGLWSELVTGSVYTSQLLKRDRKKRI
ncbi:unnamed protein product [Fraxinus pennsylvanica]|uniref:Uncharacterized protein n=1 Tax=Fraxinus pennsylvanica TaxID=56036 RepID=A0AAD2EAM5_9LAMI|nr:unnamed protein product [Fraxinus pennsylvanica]